MPRALDQKPRRCGTCDTHDTHARLTEVHVHHRLHVAWGEHLRHTGCNECLETPVRGGPGTAAEPCVHTRGRQRARVPCGGGHGPSGLGVHLSCTSYVLLPHRWARSLQSD